MQAAHLLLAVDAGVGEALGLQAVDGLVGQADHLVAIAELQGAGLAGGDAGRGHAVVDAVDAAVALVDDRVRTSGELVIAGHVVGAGGGAVLAAHALVGVVGDHAGLLVAEEGAGRADLHAACVGAVLAAAAAKGPAHALLAFGGLELVEGHDQAGGAVDVCRVLVDTLEVHGIGTATVAGGQVVPALAGNLAALARGAAGGVEQHCFLSHRRSPPMPSRC